jgi:hypothetical protein
MTEIKQKLCERPLANLAAGAKPFHKVFGDEVPPYAMGPSRVNGPPKAKRGEMAGGMLQMLESHIASNIHFLRTGDDANSPGGWRLQSRSQMMNNLILTTIPQTFRTFGPHCIAHVSSTFCCDHLMAVDIRSRSMASGTAAAITSHREIHCKKRIVMSPGWAKCNIPVNDSGECHTAFVTSQEIERNYRKVLCQRGRMVFQSAITEQASHRQLSGAARE